MSLELLTVLENIEREKGISQRVLIESVEAALVSAAKKVLHDKDKDVQVKIDLATGKINIFSDGKEIVSQEFGRIAAQTAKQVIIQRIRDAERDVIYGDYEHKVNNIVTGSVSRIEAGNVIVNLGKAEGIIPKHEKVRSENYNPGDRVKAIIYDVKKVGPKVKIMLSRSDPELVKKLFEIEVPEIAEHVIEIRGIAREPGFRTKIAVHSNDSRVDCIGACVGIRGTRIKSITDELNGEKIDIIRHSDNLDEMVMNSLRPAQISNIDFDEPNKIARVLVPDDQLSLAIGKKGQNVRLASRLTGYDIKISSPTQAALGAEAAAREDAEVEKAREALLSEPAAPAPSENGVHPEGSAAPPADAPEGAAPAGNDDHAVREPRTNEDENSEGTAPAAEGA